MQGVNLGEAGYVNICKHHQNECWGHLFTVGCNWRGFRVGKKHSQGLV